MPAIGIGCAALSAQHRARHSSVELTYRREKERVRGKKAKPVCVCQAAPTACLSPNITAAVYILSHLLAQWCREFLSLPQPNRLGIPQDLRYS